MTNENMRQFYIINDLISASTLSECGPLRRPLTSNTDHTNRAADNEHDHGINYVNEALM